MPDEPTEMLTPDEAARRLGVTVRTLHRWEAEGIIPPPARTPTGHRRYRADDIAAILTRTPKAAS